MLLRVGFYNGRCVLVSLYRGKPIIVLGSYHSVYRGISFVSSGKLYLVSCILEDDNRSLLELLYSPHTILGCDRPLEVLVVVGMQRLGDEKMLLALFGKIFRCCPRKKPQLRGSYSEINMLSGPDCIMKLP